MNVTRVIAMHGTSASDVSVSEHQQSIFSILDPSTILDLSASESSRRHSVAHSKVALLQFTHNHCCSQQDLTPSFDTHSLLLTARSLILKY